MESNQGHTQLTVVVHVDTHLRVTATAYEHLVLFIHVLSQGWRQASPREVPLHNLTSSIMPCSQYVMATDPRILYHQQRSEPIKLDQRFFCFIPLAAESSSDVVLGYVQATDRGNQHDLMGLTRYRGAIRGSSCQISRVFFR